MNGLVSDIFFYAADSFMRMGKIICGSWYDCLYKWKRIVLSDRNHSGYNYICFVHCWMECRIRTDNPEFFSAEDGSDQRWPTYQPLTGSRTWLKVFDDLEAKSLNWWQQFKKKIEQSNRPPKKPPRFVLLYNFYNRLISHCRRGTERVSERPTMTPSTNLWCMEIAFTFIWFNKRKSIKEERNNETTRR